MRHSIKPGVAGAAAAEVNMKVDGAIRGYIMTI
jgi:hypothetical protein